MKTLIRVRRFTWSLSVAVATLSALPVRALAQGTDAETWARALVDSQFHQNGDDDALAASWLDLIAAEPQHPLCEVTLRMLDQQSTQDVRKLQDRLLALDPTKFLPASAAVLTRIRSSIRVARTPRDQADKWKRSELYPDRLALASTLGPLGHPLDRAARAKLLAQPEFDREHTGLGGRKLHWKNFERPLAEPSIDPDTEMSPVSGWAMLAFEFDVERGGPAWIDFDLHGAFGPMVLEILSAQDRPWSDAIADPSWSYSINDAAPVEVDYLRAERSPSERAPAVLRKGRNRVLIACNLDANLKFAVRVLSPDGRPLPGVAGARDHRELGAKVDAQPPSNALVTSESYLASLAHRGPDSEVLLGTLEALDARPAAGFARLRAAVDAAPDRTGLKAWLSNSYSFAFHLPDSWKRARARELAEQVVAADPARADMQLALARVLAPEDKEEEAIAKLDELSRRTPWSADAPLELANTYPRLDLEVPAERALFEAQTRAPQSPRVLNSLAEHLENVGLPTQALALREKSASISASSDNLTRLGDAQSALGLAEDALASYRAAVAFGDLSERAGLATHLETLGRYDEADAIWAELEKRFEGDSTQSMARADIARLRGDEKAELEHLREAIRREPSHSSARDRVLAITGHEVAHDMLQRYALDTEKVVASFDANKWNDSVVRVIDAAVTYVFEDGGYEQITHARTLVRDLQGCETEGTQRASGEVLEIATIKADGVRYEPTETNGEYVMPSLQPGDSVELITRTTVNSPSDGVVRLPGWRFADETQPYHVSRFVISLPKSLPIKVELRHFDGDHQTIDEGDRVVHVLETRDSPRVLLEPGSPPADWILPLVSFTNEPRRAEIAEELARESTLAVRVTPEIRDAALKAVSGIDGQEEQAKVLHALVTHAIDKRLPLSRASALSALLTHQGNATVLYAALLEAAGIERDIVWSRDFVPSADPQPDPPELDAQRWMRRLLLLVKPKDGREAWCDMSQRTRGYGTPLDDSPKASAFSTATKQWIDLPDVPTEELGAERQSVSIALDGERGADVEIALELSGNVGFGAKENLRSASKTQRKGMSTNLANSILPGTDVESYDLPGIDTDGGPLSIVVKGKVKSMLDEAGGELACKLPIPPAQLAGLAAGEGERKRAYYLASFFSRDGVIRVTPIIVKHNTVKFVLPEGWKLAQAFTDLREEFHGLRYSLTYEAEGERAFTLKRELVLPPLVLQPNEYPDFVALTKRIDEAERTRLRFTKPAGK